jgi:hypothetical protein
MNARTKLATMLGGAAVFGTVAGLTAGVATAAPSQTDGAMLYMCQDVGTPAATGSRSRAPTRWIRPTPPVT